MPPGVALEQNGPGKANRMSPPSHLGAEEIIEIPDEEPANENRQSCHG